MSSQRLYSPDLYHRYQMALDELRKLDVDSRYANANSKRQWLWKFGFAKIRGKSVRSFDVSVKAVSARVRQVMSSMERYCSIHKARFKRDLGTGRLPRFIGAQLELNFENRS